MAELSCQAALGVVEGVVLDERVQAFFDSPEIGLIRVKQAQSLSEFKMYPTPSLSAWKQIQSRQVDPPEHLKGVLRPYQLLGDLVSKKLTEQ